MVLDGILYFAENMGQMKSGCRYVLEQSSFQILFFDDVVEFVLYGEEKDDHIFLNLNLRDSDTYAEQDEMFLSAADKMNISISYMSGPRGEWIRNVPVYERICYHNVCDGIDMEFFIEDGKLKQNFIMCSERNLDDLKLEFTGQKDLYSNGTKGVIIVGDQDIFELETPYNYFKQQLICTV